MFLSNIIFAVTPNLGIAILSVIGLTIIGFLIMFAVSSTGDVQVLISTTLKWRKSKKTTKS